MAGPLLAITAGIQGAMGLAQAITGIGQKNDAAEMARNAVRPVKRIEQGYRDNLNLAESRASQGLGDAAMTVYENNMDRAMTSNTNAILMGGGDVNTIADLYDNAADNFSTLALLEEEIRMKNTQQYMLASERYAQEQEKAWMVNEYGPYKDTMQAATALQQQGTSNLWGGLGTAAQAVGNYHTGSQLEKQTNSLRTIAARGVTGVAPTVVNSVGLVPGATLPSRTNPYIPEQYRVQQPDRYPVSRRPSNSVIQPPIDLPYMGLDEMGFDIYGPK